MKEKTFFCFPREEKKEFQNGLNSLVICIPFLANSPPPSRAQPLFPSALAHRITMQLILEVGLHVYFKNAAVSVSGNPPGGSRCVEYLYMSL